MITLILLFLILLAMLWAVNCLKQILAALKNRPEVAVTAAPGATYAPGAPPIAAHHEILNESGEVVARVPHKQGITDEIKAALKTPGMRVRWSHGGIEDGQE